MGGQQKTILNDNGSGDDNDINVIISTIMKIMTIMMMMMPVHRESIERVYEENSYLGERTR